MNNYFNKYIKYKNKYINLKNNKLIGGSDFAIANNEKKIFLITLGPTGSGKSKLVDASLKYLNNVLGLKLKTSEFKKILIDDLIENNDIYKTNFNNILLHLLQQDSLYCYDIEYKTNIDSMLDNNTTLKNYQAFFDGLNVEQKKLLNDKLDNPSVGLTNDVNNIYFYVRSYGCYDEQSRSKSCDTKNDNTLLTSITENKNIIFETTGENNLDWLFKIIPEDKYDIIISCPIVTYCKLKQRNAKRASSQLHTYFEDIKNKSAPRLAILKDTIFKSKVKNIEQNLKELIKLNRYRILVFNNNDTEMTFMFDSSLYIDELSTNPDLYKIAMPCEK